MDRIPLGVARLDAIINGGAPPGSVVLLAGDAGAGAREFLYTSAVMNGLANSDEELFDLNYGTVHEGASVPDEVHYVSFTASEDELRRELGQVISQDIVDASVEAIEFQNLSTTYFQLSPVPRSWYAGESQRISDIGRRDDRRDVMEAAGDYFDEHAPENLVLVDSLTDLASIVGDRMDWSDITLLVKGLRQAAQSWNGLIVLLVDKEAISDTEFGKLMASAHGTLVFEWAAGGQELARTMAVKEFRGVLSEIEEEDIVRFETEITDGGFDISDIRKIR